MAQLTAADATKCVRIINIKRYKHQGSCLDNVQSFMASSDLTLVDFLTETHAAVQWYETQHFTHITRSIWPTLFKTLVSEIGW